MHPKWGRSPQARAGIFLRVRLAKFSRFSQRTPQGGF